MNSYLVVAETPYHAVTEPTAASRSRACRPGEYKVEVWHEKLGKEKAHGTVKADGSSEPLEIKLGEAKKGRRR